MTSWPSTNQTWLTGRYLMAGSMILPWHNGDSDFPGGSLCHYWQDPSKHLGGGKSENCPLVNIQKTMGKSLFLMGKSTIMAMFNSYVSLPEGICLFYETVGKSDFCLFDMFFLKRSMAMMKLLKFFRHGHARTAGINDFPFNTEGLNAWMVPRGCGSIYREALFASKNG